MAGQNSALPLVRPGASSCSARDATARDARTMASARAALGTCFGERMMDILESNREQRAKMLELQERENILLQNITAVFSNRARAHHQQEAALPGRAERRKRHHTKPDDRRGCRAKDRGSRECSRASNRRRDQDSRSREVSPQRRSRIRTPSRTPISRRASHGRKDCLLYTSPSPRD